MIPHLSRGYFCYRVVDIVTYPCKTSSVALMELSGNYARPVRACEGTRGSRRPSLSILPDARLELEGTERWKIHACVKPL